MTPPASILFDALMYTLLHALLLITCSMTSMLIPCICYMFWVNKLKYPTIRLSDYPSSFIRKKSRRKGRNEDGVWEGGREDTRIRVCIWPWSSTLYPSTYKRLWYERTLASDQIDQMLGRPSHRRFVHQSRLSFTTTTTTTSTTTPSPISSINVLIRVTRIIMTNDAKINKSNYAVLSFPSMSRQIDRTNDDR